MSKQKRDPATHTGDSPPYKQSRQIDTGVPRKVMRDLSNIEFIEKHDPKLVSNKRNSVEDPDPSDGSSGHCEPQPARKRRKKLGQHGKKK